MIVFFHLLNDRSGSPRALLNAMTALARKDARQQLYLGQGGDGFLGESSGAELRRFPYARGSNKLATLRAYLGSQWRLWRMLRAARDIDRDAICYVNTLLPFAPAIFGRLSGRTVIYHLHEVSLKPRLLQWFLLFVVRQTAARTICVSDFHRRTLGLPSARVVYNAIAEPMYERGLRAHYAPRRDGVFRVSMLCSLRDYKGVPEFLQLAADLADDASVQFQLVVNDDAEAVENYFASRSLPPSVQILRGVEDVSQVYEDASLVLNLSRVDQWVETFGLTLLEAMTFGVPVIAPPAGGPVELVNDGQQGFLVDSRDAAALRDKVAQLANDPALCLEMSRAARSRAQELSPERFSDSICAAVFGNP